MDNHERSMEKTFAKKGKSSDSPKKVFPAREVTSLPPMGGVAGYEDLARVLTLAYDQSARGKGKVRHSSNNSRPFHDQPICTIPASKSFLIGLGGLSYQIEKKSGETDRMCERAMPAKVGSMSYQEGDVEEQLRAALNETLGVIVYAAAKYLYIEKQLRAYEQAYEDDHG